MKNLKQIITVSLILIFIIGALVGISLLKSNVSDRASVEPNPDDEIGNTAGNLYSHGLFAEKDGRVYFSNPYANGNIYSMNPDQSDMKKIAVGNASFINVLGNYIYYYSANGDDANGLGYIRDGRSISRTDINGKSTYPLFNTTTDGVVGVGNNILFTSFNEDENSDNAIITVDKIGLDGKNHESLITEHIVPGAIQYGKLYYGGMKNDHCLYSLNLTTNAISQESSNSMLYPIVDGDIVYYLDVLDNYRLKSCSLSSGEVTTIVNERVDIFNYYNGLIVYQNCDPDNGYALKRINVDGSGLDIIKEGVYKDINITSSYIYFREFQNDVPVYQTPTFESGSVTTFDNALHAAMEN